MPRRRRQSEVVKLTLEERFWSKVDKRGPDECWPWGGYKAKSGHGSTSDGCGGSIGAHRLAYILAVGEIPTGLCVCHKCDNPPCVNPDHLYAGTYKQNTADRKLRGAPFRPMLFLPLEGQRIGAWTMIETARRAHATGRPCASWVCRCDCGTVRTVAQSALVRGESGSCRPCAYKLRKVDGKKARTSVAVAVAAHLP